MLAPHYAEDAEFGERRFASAQKLLDFFVLVECESVLPDCVRREGSGYRSCHGRNFYCRILAAREIGLFEKPRVTDFAVCCYDSSAMKSIIVGTAGHIDHGKTALVKALTGIDADRLMEEKRRGITIDLGFAHMELPGADGETLRLGFVDVPGHERFVRNMLAGVSGIDLVLLVIAADESIKPQTREHFDILQLIGVKRGITVLTKSDAVDSETLDVVRLEVEEYLRGTFLETPKSPIVA